jgi:HlyD family secretion protein
MVALACSAGCRSPQQTASAAAGKQDVTRQAEGVGCLGRIEPLDGVVHVAARALGGQPSIVGRLLVKEGDAVRVGQVLAELESRHQLEAAVLQAQAQIEVARKRLAQVQAGAKPSELAAQQAEIERLQMELTNAEQEHRRYASLGDNVTRSQIDALQLRVDATSKSLTAAKQRLASLTEVRPVDVELARAEFDAAVRNEARARAERDATIIHSPTDGRVTKIFAWPGEQVQNEGLLELAPAGPVYVVAEVPESDIRRVKVGQRAAISGDGVPPGTEGTVERIAIKVLQNQLVHVDPATFSDARIVNVWIKVANGEPLANLINMRVDVIIRS